MAIQRGIVQFHTIRRLRERLLNAARDLERARVSARGGGGEPLIAIVMSPEDRDMLVEVIRRMAEVVEIEG